MVKICQNANDPVDGSEIRPLPVELGSFSHYLQGFIHQIRWLCRISEPSTVSTPLLKLGTQKTLGISPLALVYGSLRIPSQNHRRILPEAILIWENASVVVIRDSNLVDSSQNLQKTTTILRIIRIQGHQPQIPPP